MSFDSADSFAGQKRVSIVIVEPQLVFVPFLTGLLSRAGFAVIGAFDESTLERIAAIEPRVVLIDVDYLNANPLVVLLMLRESLPQAAICAYSERTDQEWNRACAYAGATRVISKAASQWELLDSIDESLLTL